MIGKTRKLSPLFAAPVDKPVSVPNLVEGRFITS